MLWQDLHIKLDYINAKIKWLGRNPGRSRERRAEGGGRSAEFSALRSPL